MTKGTGSEIVAPIVELDASFGVIDAVVGNTVVGWLLTPNMEAHPLLLVDGRPAELVEWPQTRPDVQRALKIAGDTGFCFRVPHLKADSLMELFAIQGDTLRPICSKRAEQCVIERNPLYQLVNARTACMSSDAVAVTCWDAAHNPVGRAKVLYDIIEKRRPVVLFAYLFDEFGSTIWPPLRDCNFRAVLIPWEQRDVYHNLIRQMEISFNTVWLCKPRYPTFRLAEQVASSNAKLVVDLDDNEEHFAKSDAARDKPYGSPFINLSRNLLSRICARTVASVSLQEEFGGKLVRHAREPRAVAPSAVQGNSPINVGFIGTVRPHKNIIAAARALKLFSWKTNTQIVFHVYGDVKPDSLKNELAALDVRLRDTVPSNQLVSNLEELDVILTGFPSPESANSEVTRHQITAKIGDALCAGRPVLVPDTESVRDLHDLAGVFLFGETSFGRALSEALGFEGKISLPDDFTLDGAYAAFKAAEELAGVSPKADTVFGAADLSTPAVSSAKPDRNLLLVWKQNDAGLYGRRIDQIARSYKRRHPGSQVVVLEFMHERTLQGHNEKTSNPVSEAAHIVGLSEKKAGYGYIDDDGVIYREIRYKSSDRLREFAIRFFAVNNLTPANTTVVIFPIISFLEKIQEVFSAFPLIVDVVDNQFSWNNTATSSKMASQYGSLLMAADHIVFNSAVNKEYFQRRFGPAFKSGNASLISNWYNAPASNCNCIFEKTNDWHFNIIYTGNMNDRMDWSLIELVADMSYEIRVHLAGSAERAGPRFQDALKKPNIIYHGILEERRVLDLLQDSHLAIIPHAADAVSNFMNPLKLHMYVAANVPVATTCVEGITAESSLVTRHEDRSSFIQFVASCLSKWRDAQTGGPGKHSANLTRGGSSVCSGREEEYVQLINSLKELPTLAT